MTEPLFFRFGSALGRGHPYAYAISPSPAVVSRKTCEGCGRDVPLSYGGSIALKVEDGPGLPPATEWPDSLDCAPFAPTSLLLAEEVVPTLESEQIASFVAWPAEVIQNDCKQLIGAAPRYFYLDVTGRIDIDLDASGLAEAVTCPRCFSRDRYVEPRQLVPRRETWDGSDLFQVRNYPTTQTFCTRRVVELARRERWSNFRFEPMDVLTRYSYGFKGADYLGREWPPCKWYPDAPQEGKSVGEWLQALRNPDRTMSYQATRALLELGDAPVSPLIVFLNDLDPVTRYRAANVLRGLFRQGVAVPTDIMRRVADEMRDG